MKAPPIPDNESQRLDSLRQLRLLDTPHEERFDRITRIACDLFRVPVALITLVDDERQWFKSRQGLDLAETPREHSFCAHAILGEGPFVVENTLEDKRFVDNPLVTGAPGIRAYAGMPVRTIDGKPLGTLCVIDRQPRVFDAADRQRLRDLAAWVEREINLTVEIESAIREMRDTFVKLVSHELRTPVTGIVGALDLMSSGAAQGEDLDALTRMATDGADRLNRIVDDIVEMAELDARQTHRAAVRIELEYFLEAAMETHREPARQRGVSIIMDVESGLAVMASQQSLVRVLRALLDNAISYSPTGTAITLHAGRTGQGMVRISVEDCGPGIPAEHLPRLFMPFTQVDTSDTRKRDGCGVSLAISRRLAQEMGGRLGYEPSAAGGSRFYLDLPG